MVPNIEYHYILLWWTVFHTNDGVLLGRRKHSSNTSHLLGECLWRPPRYSRYQGVEQDVES